MFLHEKLILPLNIKELGFEQIRNFSRKVRKNHMKKCQVAFYNNFVYDNILTSLNTLITQTVTLHIICNVRIIDPLLLKTKMYSDENQKLF